VVGAFGDRDGAGFLVGPGEGACFFPCEGADLFVAAGDAEVPGVATWVTIGRPAATAGDGRPLSITGDGVDGRSRDGDVAPGADGGAVQRLMIAGTWRWCVGGTLFGAPD
jgi:hypothetical protein